MLFSVRSDRPIIGRIRARQALLCVTTTAGLLWTVGQAHAQARAASEANEGAPATDQLQEVVVTAEKRESGLQKTPVAVTAVSQDQLVQSGVAEYTSLQKVAPDVNITNS